jgi:nucleotide-binding universal stress UspA family protein
VELMRPAPEPRPLGRAGHAAPVVVGASPDADAAVGWALRHARRADLPVHLVRAYDAGELRPNRAACALGVPSAGVRDVLARAVLTRARRIAREVGWTADVDPSVEVAPGDAVQVLVHAARGASMLVVGHGEGGLGSLWGLGSVGLGALWHATSSVTVVRPAPDDGPVVVGVDGSFDATEALRHALTDGAARDVRTVVVAAGIAARPGWLQAHLDTVLREVTEAGTTPGSVVVVADDDRPERVLLDAASRYRAAVLIVGHRGRGRTASLALGSVGHELVVGASVPVTVVRPVPA